MKRLAALAALGLLTACGDVKDKPLKSVDFSDPKAVQAIALELSPADRPGFQRYAVTRIMSAPFGGVGLTRKDGRLPASIREAIELGKREQRLEEMRNQLMGARNAAVDRKNALLGPDYGLSDKNKAEWDRLDNVIAEDDRKISALDAQSK